MGHSPNENELVHQAQEDFNAGRYSRAEEELARAVKSEPRNWSGWFYLGVTRAQLKETGPAIEALQQARLLAPTQPPIYLNLALLYMEEGKVDEALGMYREGILLDPKNEIANQNYALLLMQRRRFREAVAPLERLKKIKPDDVSTRATLVEAYLQAGLKSEGEQEIEELLKSHLASMPEELALAKLLITDRQVGPAEAILKHTTTTWPDSAETHGELGLLLLQGEQYDGAVGELGRAVQLDPNSAKYSLGVGEALLRWRHDPIALEYLLAIRDKFGELPIYKFQLALAYFYLPRFAMAIPAFENLAREEPKSGKVQYFLGGSYQATGELKKAEDCYRKAIELDPHQAPYYTALASLIRKENPSNLSEPILLLKKAIALNPSDEEGKLALASCFGLEGKLGEAQALLEQVVRVDPASRRAHTALAKIYYRQKRLDEAQQQESIAAKLTDEKMKEISPWGPGESISP